MEKKINKILASVLIVCVLALPIVVLGGVLEGLVRNDLPQALWCCGAMIVTYIIARFAINPTIKDLLEDGDDNE